MQTIAPTKGQVFAKPLEAITKTASGILLGDKSAEKPKMAEVVNVGEGVTAVKSQQVFVYKSYAATDIKLNAEDYLLIAEEDILGVVLDVEA